MSAVYKHHQGLPNNFGGPGQNMTLGPQTGLTVYCYLGVTLAGAPGKTSLTPLVDTPYHWYTTAHSKMQNDSSIQTHHTLAHTYK
jgi:hypothetical protein